jgi:hypothetical protein
MHPYNVGVRLEFLIKTLELNPNSFSIKTGIPVPTIHYIIGKKGRKTNPSFHVIQKIAKTFKNVNIRWFLTGDGPMFADPFEMGDASLKLAITYQTAMRDQKKSIQKLQQTLDNLVEEKASEKKPAKMLKKK